MKMKRKTLFIVLGSLLLVGVSATALLAGPFGHCSFGDREHHGEFMLEMLDFKIHKLDLSEEQQAQYQQIRARIEADVEQGRRLHEELHAEIEAVLDSDNPDLHAVAESVKIRLDNIPVMATKYIDYLLEIYDILDAEQQAKVLAEIQDHRPCHDD
ncbi:MAG: periplasmic heavy metal sensor [Desulfovibrio sp.]|nr:MAG: periplasmic heavy metal sensor [Desulfovibrio sp.]